jgi:hypothetical protein
MTPRALEAEENDMRFMVFVKANADSEAGVMPSDELLVAMGRFNEELVKAGVMLDGGGLHPSKRGARVRFGDGAPTVIDGPFPETKELVAGYWLLECKSWDEVIAWMKRVPNTDGKHGEIEIRQLFELSDFDMSAEAKQVHDDVQSKLQER